MTAPAARTFFPVVFALLILARPLSAAGEGPLSGRIVDPDGRPIAGANVLVTSGATLVRSVATGADGTFTIPAVPERELTVRVAAPGFTAPPLQVHPARTTGDLGTIRLSIGALSEAVVVSAAQAEIPLTQAASSVTILTGEELQSRQIHSLADALRTVPGVTVSATGGFGGTTGLFPRGGESNFTLVIVDGVPANDFGGDFDFAQVATGNVDRIEIVRGPQSALFGSNAIGAVVRIITRRGGAPSAYASLEGGGFGSSRIAAGTSGARGRLEWGASLDRTASDGFNGERVQSGALIENDDYERRTASLSAGWRDRNRWLRADARHSTDERGFPGPFGRDPGASYFGVDVVSRGDNRRTQASLAGSTLLAGRVRGQAHLAYNSVNSDFESAFGSSEGYSRRWTGRAQTDLAIAPGLDLSAGVEAQRERAGSTFITGAALQRIPVERTTVGTFMEGRLNVSDRLLATAGLRVERIQRERLEPSGSRPELAQDEVVSANPKIAAAWIARGDAASFTKVRGAAGTGIRPPDGFELAFTDNPALRPERSTAVEAGIDQAFAGGLAVLEATAFFNSYDDLIVAVGSFSHASRFQTDNISNARSRGVELALKLRGRLAPRVEASARFGYTGLDTEILAVDRDTEAPPPFAAGQPLLRRPKHQFFADMSLSAGRASAFVRAAGRNRTLDVDPSLGTFGGLFEAAGYQVWDAGASWQVARFAELFGRVENLFDRGYEEALGFPALGRRATVGLRIAAGR